MKLQIFHCASVSFEDEKPSKKPEGIIPKPMEDIHVELSSDDLADPVMASLLSMFEEIDLQETHDSPIQVRREFVANKLGLDSFQAKQLFTKARSMHLLEHLTIKKDYGAWLRNCEEKGCLVVMTCVEAGDFDRADLQEAFCEEILAIRKQVTGGSKTLDELVLVPNAHLTPGDKLETDSKRAQAVIERLRTALDGLGMKVHEASFGFGKRVGLVILGHPRSYTFHAI